MFSTPSSSRSPVPRNHQTYDRRISKEVARLDPETKDAIVQCNPGGCAITAQEVEKNLSVGYPVIPGSLKFRDDEWTDEENTALFTVQLTGGAGSILGSVTIKAVVEATKVTAYSDIRIINVKGHPVALFPKKPETRPESVVARLLGRG
jgi:hypothetical protein